jgi:hypothetical protein
MQALKATGSAPTPLGFIRDIFPSLEFSSNLENNAESYTIRIRSHTGLESTTAAKLAIRVLKLACRLGVPPVAVEIEFVDSITGSRASMTLDANQLAEYYMLNLPIEDIVLRAKFKFICKEIGTEGSTTPP